MTGYYTYKCDKCGKEWRKGDGEQPVAVGILLQFGSELYTDHGTHKTKTQCWCRTCVMAKGFYDPIKPKDKEVAPPVPPSFEDIFTELLDSLGYIRE
jgi:hypothetical protein